MRRKDILPVFLAFILGFIMGVCLPTISAIMGIIGWLSSGLTLAFGVDVLFRYFQKREKNRIRQEEFLVKELEKWMKKTTFTKIDYQNGNISSIDHKDPISLHYYDELINVLKTCNIYSYWENGITESRCFNNKGIKAFNNFQSMVKNKLKTPLEKTCETEKIPYNSYSFPLVCDGIIMKLKGDPRNFAVDHYNPFLYYGTTKVAHGEDEKIKQLKNNIEELIKNENIIEKIEDYNKFKKDLDCNTSFTDFKTMLKYLIEDWKRFHEFRPQSSDLLRTESNQCESLVFS